MSTQKVNNPEEYGAADGHAWKIDAIWPLGDLVFFQQM